jgi:hypothetical protein
MPVEPVGELLLGEPRFLARSDEQFDQMQMVGRAQRFQDRAP